MISPLSLKDAPTRHVFSGPKKFARFFWIRFTVNDRANSDPSKEAAQIVRPCLKFTHGLGRFAPQGRRGEKSPHAFTYDFYAGGEPRSAPAIIHASAGSAGQCEKRPVCFLVELRDGEPVNVQELSCRAICETWFAEKNRRAVVGKTFLSPLRVQFPLNSEKTALMAVVETGLCWHNACEYRTA